MRGSCCCTTARRLLPNCSTGGLSLATVHYWLQRKAGRALHGGNRPAVEGPHAQMRQAQVPPWQPQPLPSCSRSRVPSLLVSLTIDYGRRRQRLEGEAEAARLAELPLALLQLPGLQVRVAQGVRVCGRALVCACGCFARVLWWQCGGGAGGTQWVVATGGCAPHTTVCKWCTARTLHLPGTSPKQAAHGQ